MSTAFAVIFTLLSIVPGLPLLDEAVYAEQAGVSAFAAAEGRLAGSSALSQGKLLVASRRIIDPRFMQTVILLIRYDPGGAVGLIINRPTETKLSEVFPDIQGFQERPDSVYIGGPVAVHDVMFLIRSGKKPEESLKVFDDVYVSSSGATLERLAEDIDNGQRFRVYAGYAGWAPGQLEGEILRGDWHIMKADAKTVFEKTSSEIWPELILLSSGMEVRLRGSRN